MLSKGFFKLIAVLLALACVYQLSFTFKTRGVEKQAAAYAAQFPLDQQGEAEQHYLDSVQNLPVYNLGFRKFTYKECKEKELNLGLDLKGGMNVMLEVQVEDVVKALAGDSQNDPAFIEAIGVANEAMKQGSSTDYISDFVKAYSRLSNGRPIAELFVSPDRKDITLESSDADVEKILKKETEAAIGASFNVLRSRIDHFGVTQPNILRLPNSHRILVELPGVKEPQRVRDLLQGTASLEFWTTYDANEIFPALSAADKLIKAELAQAPAAAPETAAAEAAAAAGTPAAEAEGLIAEVGAADSTATAETAVQEGNFDHSQNPLFAVLNPRFAGGASIGAAYKADMAAVNEYLAQPAVRELFPADIMFKWGVKGDDKIDGRFYLCAIKVSTPDGTAPLVLEAVTPGAAGLYLDLGQFYDRIALQKERRAIELLQTRYRALYREAYARLVIHARPSCPLPAQEERSRRFLRAVTCRGLVSAEPPAGAVQLVSGEELEARRARETAVLYQNPLFPDETEAVYLPDEKRYYRGPVTPLPDLSVVTALLAQAKALHDELEAIYNPHVDFARVYALANSHALRLFKEN